jgi:ABC-type multidrug transport system fused ATPase/permease subunit
MYWGLMALVAGAGVAAGLTIGALRTASGAMTVDQLLLILFLVGEAFQPAREIHDAMHLAVWGMSKVERAYQVLATPPSIHFPAAPEPVAGVAPSVRFEDVRFRYRPEDRPALDGVSFSIDEGETVAIVGGSGAGKTTVASLLLRFFDPQGGTIMIGGRDVREMDPDGVRSLIALVPQDTFLFHESVRANLLLGEPSADDAELERAARWSNAAEFIERFPERYDTVVGERGLRLSGGQRQRVAIARALLKNAPILILDEATSSVEVSAEAGIQTTLERLRQGRTTLVIAHRLSTVRGADRILVLDRGRLVEEGTHVELLDRKGRYARLIAAQEEAAS